MSKDMTAKMAHAAAAAHNVNRAYCQGLGDHSQEEWGESPHWQRESAMAGVAAIIASPEITPADLHGEWLAVKESEGWIYGDVKDAEKKTHPCMIPYEDLPVEQRTKDALFGLTVRGVLGL